MKFTIILVEQNLKTTIHPVSITPNPKTLVSLTEQIKKELNLKASNFKIFFNGHEYIDELPEMKNNCTIVVHVEPVKVKEGQKIENGYVKEIIESGFFDADAEMKDTELVSYLDSKGLIREDLIENYEDYKDVLIDKVFNR